MAAGDTITVTYGEQAFSPVSYNTFRVGPFTMTTVVAEGETDEAAFDRCWRFLEARARAAFPQARNAFWDHLESVREPPK